MEGSPHHTPLPRPQLWALQAAAAGCLPVKAVRPGLWGIPELPHAVHGGWGVSGHFRPLSTSAVTQI